MAVKRRQTKQVTPLIVEAHPKDYNGFPFITLLQYNQELILCIVDLATDKNIKAYVLDYCIANGVDEESVLKVAKHWYETSYTKHPISIEFTRLQMSNVKSIYRNFSTEFITRVIGPLPKFNIDNDVQVRRRRKKILPKNIGINVYNFIS